MLSCMHVLSCMFVQACVVRVRLSEDECVSLLSLFFNKNEILIYKKNMMFCKEMRRRVSDLHFQIDGEKSKL